MSELIEDPESLEHAKIVCAECGKEIRYERPHFCPYCGQEVDATSGLEVASEESEVYPSSNIAPFLMRVFLWWLAIAFLSTAVFGKKALILTTLLFTVIAIALGISSFVFHKNKK